VLRRDIVWSVCDDTVYQPHSPWGILGKLKADSKLRTDKKLISVVLGV
jgi:hypothetical protein